MSWSTCAEPSGFACVTYLHVGVFHELHVLFMLHLHILQQHFALFLRQFQGLHLGNNTQEGQTGGTWQKHGSYKCPMVLHLSFQLDDASLWSLIVPWLLLSLSHPLQIPWFCVAPLTLQRYHLLLDSGFWSLPLLQLCCCCLEKDKTTSIKTSSSY